MSLYFFFNQIFDFVLGRKDVEDPRRALSSLSTVDMTTATREISPGNVG